MFHNKFATFTQPVLKTPYICFMLFLLFPCMFCNNWTLVLFACSGACNYSVTGLGANSTNATTICRSVGRKPGPWRIGFEQSQGNPYESAKPFTSVHHKQSECSWDRPIRGCDCHCEAREHEPMSAQLVTSLGLSSKSIWEENDQNLSYWRIQGFLQVELCSDKSSRAIPNNHLRCLEVTNSNSFEGKLGQALDCISSFTIWEAKAMAYLQVSPQQSGDLSCSLDFSSFDTGFFDIFRE